MGIENKPLTEMDKANLRLASAQVAIKFGTTNGFKRDACIAEAEKIYQFVVGQAEKPAPKPDTSKG